MTRPEPVDGMALSVMIVDDHSILTDALKLSLARGQDEHIEVVIADDLGLHAVLDLARSAQPDVVLVDLDLGEQRLGVELVGPLIRAGHSVVLFTGSTDEAAVGGGLAAGAVGVLRKTEPFVRMVEGITDAAHGRTITRPSERAELIEASERARRDSDRQSSRLDALTAREREILDLLVLGTSATEIATQEYVSLATVRSQIKSILRKLGVSSQLAAVAIARGD